MPFYALIPKPFKMVITILLLQASDSCTWVVANLEYLIELNEIILND